MFRVEHWEVLPMANYTMELREYIEMWSQDNDSMSIRDRIEAGRPKLFSFDYPIFDPDYKKVFETHFIRRFYMREIGFETEELFKFYLENYLIINMPYWNKVFLSEQMEFPIFDNTKMDVTENRTKDQTVNTTSTTDGTSNATSDATNNQTTDSTHNVTNHETNNRTQNQDTTGSITNDDFKRDLSADTPDTRLGLTATDGQGLLDYASKIDESTVNNHQTNTGSSDTTDNSTIDGTNDTTVHATGENTTHETTDQTTTVNNTGNSTIHDVDDYVESKVGKIGSQTYASMMNEYRDSLLRLENTIFKEMEKELFMLVY
jgi:hypothetical protein